MLLSSSDLAQLEATSRLLTSPLTATTPETWLLEAGAAVRDLVGGTGVVIQYPSATGPYFSEDAQDVSCGVLNYVQEVAWDGTRFSDPVVDVWSKLRRQRRMETCSWEGNDALVREQGLNVKDAPIVMDVLKGQRVEDYVSLMGNVASGETMVWVLHREHGAFRHGDRTEALLRALLPSYRVGLDALDRFWGQRMLLDTVADPIVVFDPDGREVHRNKAFACLFVDDPEAATVEAHVRRLGAQANPLARPPAGKPPARAEEAVRTARGTYLLRASMLPPSLFGTGPSLLVAVAAPPSPALPSPDALRERHGLTPREAEVALLLAKGLSNAVLAERLFISLHTARHHVENVLGKLELTNRAAVATRLLAPDG